MKILVPYLFFSGNCRAAMEFYRDCFGGEITIMQTCGEAPIDFPPESDKMIFNSEMKAEGVCIKASDNPMSTGETASEDKFSMFVGFSDNEEFEEVEANLSVGGQILMKSEQFTMLKDKFAVSWMLTSAA